MPYRPIPHDLKYSTHTVVAYSVIYDINYMKISFFIRNFTAEGLVGPSNYRFYKKMKNSILWDTAFCRMTAALSLIQTEYVARFCYSKSIFGLQKSFETLFLIRMA